MDRRARPFVLGIATFATLVACAASGALSSAAPAPAPAASVATMQNAFAIALYDELVRASPDGNLFFSPYSVFTALAMTAEGARGETAEEMGHALRLPPSLRRTGPAAAARPWNFEPVHAGLGAFARGVERRNDGGSPERRARVDSLRVALAVLADLAKRPQAGDGATAYGGDITGTATGQLVAELNAMLPPVELTVANSLWADAAFPFDPRFVQLIDEHYGTQGVHHADFARNAEAAREAVNAWVAGRTRRRITGLLPPGSVDSLTSLVLANAVWFKGRWAEPFEEALTREAPFRFTSGPDGHVTLMQHWLFGGRYGAFRPGGGWFATPHEIASDRDERADNPGLYPGSDGFQILEIPYRGGELSMVVILPGSPGGLPALEGQLGAERIAEWTGRLESRSVRVKLPKFALEQPRELGRALRGMGMTRAFAQDAQFGGMVAGKTDGRLLVGAVFHRAAVEVNERGTEAAAATAVNMKSTGAVLSTPTRPFVPAFVADHPFLFLIRDTASGAILFMGRFGGH